VPYVSPPPKWMPGQEVLAHIRQADGCSLSEAIKQLKAAISDGQIAARLPDPNSPHHPDRWGPMWWTISAIEEERRRPSPDLWRSAKIHAAGKVNFFDKASPWHAFEVSREHVLRFWPALQSLPVKRSKKAPRADGIKDAIKDLWPNGIPRGLRAKERDKRILDWLRQKGLVGLSVGETAVPRSVQRVLKSLS